MKLPVRATVSPVLIATDKTQLTQFSGGKVAYPVYLTIGNLPKSIQQKPSMHASVLIAYLSADKVAGQESEWTSKSQWLFHESMKIVLQPLKEAGVGGVLMTNASGEVHRVHPILASYVAD